MPEIYPPDPVANPPQPKMPPPKMRRELPAAVTHLFSLGDGDVLIICKDGSAWRAERWGEITRMRFQEGITDG